MFTVNPKLELNFNEPEIPFGDIQDCNGRNLSENMTKIWEGRQMGDTSMQWACFRLEGRNSFFSQSYLYKDKVSTTLTGHEDSLVLFDSPRYTSKNEVCKIGSYPLDYNFLKVKPHYLIGMSVPPIMVARISNEIYKQWLSRL